MLQFNIMNYQEIIIFLITVLPRKERNAGEVKI